MPLIYENIVICKYIHLNKAVYLLRKEYSNLPYSDFQPGNVLITFEHLFYTLIHTAAHPWKTRIDFILRRLLFIIAY